jgi:hypothetical protein
MLTYCRYKDLFANPMYKPVYFRAMGNLRFTRVVGTTLGP